MDAVVVGSRRSLHLLVPWDHGLASSIGRGHSRSSRAACKKEAERLDDGREGLDQRGLKSLDRYQLDRKVGGYCRRFPASMEHSKGSGRLECWGAGELGRVGREVVACQVQPKYPPQSVRSPGLTILQPPSSTLAKDFVKDCGERLRRATHNARAHHATRNQGSVLPPSHSLPVP